MTHRRLYDEPAWVRARTAAKLRDNYTCQRCGARPHRLEVDHIVEISDGGAPLDLTNLTTLCPTCHRRKTADEARQRARRDAGAVCDIHGTTCGTRHSRVW